MRQNLDPEGTASDADLWIALEQARLKDYVETMDGGLEAEVSE
jgi:ABC-type transport system involved in cytochrome bd biosynthesis fused ATPase/permease subunit